MPATHQELLRSSLGETTHILDIRWRGVDDDFRDCIRANLASVNPNVPVDVVVSSPSGTGEVEMNLRAAGLSGVISGRPVGFTGFVRGPYLDECSVRPWIFDDIRGPFATPRLCTLTVRGRLRGLR